MIKKLLRYQLIFMVILAVLYGASCVSIVIDQRSSYNAVQQEPPQGKSYLPYCAGGFSDEIVEKSDNSCLAERPGDFAKFALLVYAILAAMVFPLVYIISSTIRHKIR